MTSGLQRAWRDSVPSPDGELLRLRARYYGDHTMKFRKIASVVEAVQVPIEEGQEPRWVKDAILCENIILFKGGASMRTRDGSIAIAVDGDWIVKGVRGELYPVTNQVMLLDYDPITGDQDA